jgi:tetratricopeptide (TPR) repeat protein
MTGVSLAACITSRPEQHAGMAQTLAAISPAAGGENNSLLHMADAMAAEGAHSAAIPVYRRALQKDGGVLSLLGLGRALSAVGAYREAADVFKTSDDPRALRGLANAETSMGHPDAALPLLDQVLAKNPVDTDALSSKAVVLDALGRHEEAAATYARGLEIDPAHKGLRHNYGLSLALTGSDFPHAITLLQATSNGAEATAAERQSLALAYALAGDDATAAKLLTIDMGLAEAEKKLAYFGVIKGLTVAEKFQAVMAGSVQQKFETSGPAVRYFGAPEALKTETAQRVMNEAPPVPAATPAPAPAPAPAVSEMKPADEAAVPSPEPAKAAPASEAPAPTPGKSPGDAEIPAVYFNDGMSLSETETNWTVQIASYRFASQLEKGWKILKAKYTSVLGALAPGHAAIDFGNRGNLPKGKYYRLLSGPLKSRNEAVKTCRELHELGAECLIRAPGSAGGEKS